MPSIAWVVPTPRAGQDPGSPVRAVVVAAAANALAGVILLAWSRARLPSSVLVQGVVLFALWLALGALVYWMLSPARPTSSQ